MNISIEYVNCGLIRLLSFIRALSALSTDINAIYLVDHLNGRAENSSFAWRKFLVFPIFSQV